jgi:poly(3-hydroxybutyrate) depolymerase
MPRPSLTTALLLAAACVGSPLIRAGSGTSTQGDLVRRVANGHAMQYWISLPKQWDVQHEWPIVVVLEAAEKEYEANARRFMAARGDLPFIIVAPYIVSNGNQGLRDPQIFPYSPETWDLVDRDSPCAFDLAGLTAVLTDVQRDCHGQSRAYLTGFEAGTHALWAFTFRHPENLAGVVPVAGNYRGRCVDETSFSSNPARAQLPIHAMTGSLDRMFGAGDQLYAQYLEAKSAAQRHGFQNVTEEVVPGKDHAPLPAEVLAYFSTLERAR